MFCLILVSVWQYAGYMMLIYVAGFMSVSDTLKEAAMIDGCTPSQAMRNVTIPLMRTSFTTCIFLSITRCFVVYDVNLSLTKGEPFFSSVLAAMHVYNKAFTYKEEDNSVIFSYLSADGEEGYPGNLQENRGA